MPAKYSSGLFRDQADLIKPRPVLAGQIYLSALPVIRNPVKDICIRSMKPGRKKACSIDSSLNIPRLRVNDKNQVCRIHIRPYLAVDIFQLVEQTHRSAVHPDSKAPFHRKTAVHEIQCRGTVAGNKGLSVSRKSPSLSRI